MQMKMFMMRLFSNPSHNGRRVTSCALAIAGILGAQAPAKQKLAYDVTSVKLHAGNDFRMMINLGMNDGGRLNLSGVPLALMIQLAYSNGVMGGPFGPANGTLAGLPGWAQTDRF